MKRTIFIIGLTILLALAFTAPALAGGWAVVTLDELPGQVEVNQPLEIGFMVRQHGVTPLGDQSAVIKVRLAGSAKSVKVLAREEGKVGHYVAELTLPQTGEWEWSVEVFGMNQAMPALRVVDMTAAASKPAKSTTASLPLLAGGIGLLSIVGGLALQRKVRWAAALVLIGFLVSGVGFVSAANQPKAESETQEAALASTDSQVELGHDLFIAKGCMLCHAHTETNNIREFGVDMGPDLTHLTASPDYLRLWLKDPLAAKSTAQMPNLELSNAEIDMLIAFINDK